MKESLFDSPTKSNEICTQTMARRVAAMLDLDTHSFSNGDVLPQGWHFFLLAGETRKSSLRNDGFPGLGISIPDLGLPRLLLGGRSVVYNSDILIGSEVEKTSFIKNITEKTTQSGRMAIVTIQHELRPFLASNSAIIETQTYILLEEKKNQTTTKKTLLQPIETEYQKIFIPDETLLFQYSALGFNSHKIHLDKDYARNVDGFPDLVVNGGLATLLLTEFLRTELGLQLTEIKVKHLVPLFCGQALTLAADRGPTHWQLKIFDDHNTLAVEMDAKIK
jgi:3-methylfumaryl-CoA hydratase